MIKTEGVHWSQMTEEEFCSERELLSNVENGICANCWFVSKCWTDDMGVILCISCSHEYYSDFMHEAGAYE